MELDLNQQMRVAQAVVGSHKYAMIIVIILSPWQPYKTQQITNLMQSSAMKLRCLSGCPYFAFSVEYIYIIYICLTGCPAQCIL